jgi:hypothetical protein
MSYEYFTVISAAPGFWEKEFKNQKKKIEPHRIINNNVNSITIWTDNFIPVQYILKLSRDYPEEIFQVKVYGDDIYNNYVYLYECCNGNSILVKEGYEYCFSADADLFNKLGTVGTNEFMQKIASLFNKVERSAEKIYLNIGIGGSQHDADFTNEDFYITAIYKTRNLRLKAHKQGRTHVKVDIEPVNEVKK